nr:polyprotein [Human cosavirus]
MMGANNSKESVNSSGNNGTTVNNFYANNYYGSIDASSQGVGTSTAPENGNVSGFLGLASSAFNALSFLATPSVEKDTNMEDRLLTRNAGNTSVNSQASEGVLHGYGVKSDSSDPTSCGDSPTRAAPATSRGFTVRLLDWKTTTQPYYAQLYRLTDRMKDIELGNMFSKNLLTHSFTKTGFEVTLQINTSPFHSGLVGLFLVPELIRRTSGDLEWMVMTQKLSLYDPPTEELSYSGYETQTITANKKVSFDLADTTPEQMMLYPHQLINPKDTNVAVVRVPYVNAAPTNDPSVHNIWTAVIMVLAPLQFSDGASPTVAMTLTITPVDTVFNGLHHAPADTQSPFPTRPFHHSYQFSTTVPDVTEPCYGMTVTPPRDYLPGHVKDLVSLAKVPSFLTVDYTNNADKPYFEVSNTKQDTPLFTCSVLLSDLHFQHTLVSVLGTYFANYRGSLQFTFISCTTAMTRGKILVSYTPPGAGKPTNITQAMQGTYAIWDLGLQSSFHFVTPFISAVDFRINAVSASSAVNSDGWVTVWLLNPLTYPPNTPPTQRIVALLSAGDDFSYRLPISPAWAQGPEPSSVEPHDNLEKGESATHDASLISGHSVGMNVPQSDVKFFFDRYRFLGILESTPNEGPLITSPYSDTTFKVKDLATMFTVDSTKRPYTAICVSPTPSIDGSVITTYLVSTQMPRNDYKYIFCAGDPHLYRSCPFTYFHADVEVTIKPPPTVNQRWRVTWYPPGAPIDTQTIHIPTEASLSPTTVTNALQSSASLFSLNPTFYGNGGNAVSFVIPFCSPLSAIPLYFDGYPDYKRSPGAYGIGPASTFGTLTIDSDGPRTFFSVYIRYKNFKGHVPRPVIRFPTVNPNTQLKYKTLEGGPPRPVPTKKKTITNKELLRQCGDVEENPGPTYSKFQTQGPTVDLLNLARNPQTVENVTRLLNTLNTLMDKWNNMKQTLTSASFYSEILCLLIKLGSLFYLVHGQGPSAYFAASAILVADGVSFLDWHTRIKQFLSTKLRTTPPFFALAQGIDLRDAVTFFNAARGAEWMVGAIKSLIDWIKKWLELEEQNEGVILEQMLIESPKHCKAINEYNRGEVFIRPAESFDFIDRLCNLAMSQGKVHLSGYFKNFISADSDPCRPEPVVLVLRGKPGAGKSAAATLIAAAVSKLCVGTQSVYSLSPDTQHMDGYRGQFAMIMDDLGQNPDGEDFRSFCQMVSCCQYRPSMANLNDKGILFSSRLLIATTNLVDFRPLTIADPRALERRITFDYVVAPGSQTSKKGMLDLEKALTPDGPGEGPFVHDCPILHLTGLTFTSARQPDKVINLVDLVESIVKRLQKKKTVGRLLDSLVAQGPKMVGYTKDDDGVVIVDNMEQWNAILDKKKKQQVLEKISEGLSAKHQEHKETLSLLKQFLTGLGVVSAVVAAFYTTKWLKSKLEPPEETEKAVDETDSSDSKAEGPYESTQKKTLKTLKLRAQAPLFDMEKKILSNVKQFKLHYNKKLYAQSCLAIGERIILVNAHAFHSVDEGFTIDGKYHTLDQVDVCALDTAEGLSDVVAIKLPPGPAFKSIVNLFLPYSVELIPGQRLIILSNDDIQMAREGSFLRNEDFAPTNIGNIPFVSLYKSSSYFGMCGSAVTARLKEGSGIIGIHCAGGGGVSVCCRLTRRMVESVREYFYPMLTQGLIVSTDKGPVIHVPRKSKLKRTSVTFPSTSLYGPAVLSKNDPRLNPDVDFDTVIFSKHQENRLIRRDSTHWEKLVMAAQIYASIFKGNDFSPLTVEEAISGIPGLDRLDPNTASGLPYTKTRKQLVDFKECKILDKELQERLDTWLKGEQPPTQYQTFLKDEIRPIEKVKSGKTRIIDVTPLDHVIAFRMLFGRFMAFFHTHPGFKLGSAVGCDPDTFWNPFATQLCKHQKLFDFDYSNFDSSHSTDIFSILQDYFFTPENGFDVRCKLLLQSLAISEHCYEDKRLKVFGGLPSGTAGTSVINTVINNIIFKAACYHTYTNFEWDDVIMMAYGDDIIAASDYDLRLDLIKDFMCTIGYKITPADKSSEFTPKTIEQVQFLKRKFRKVAGIWAPVMDTENLEAMLSWYKPGTMNEKLNSVAQLAHFSGDQVFEHLFGPFRKDGFDVKQWKQLHLEWLNKFSF